MISMVERIVETAETRLLLGLRSFIFIESNTVAKIIYSIATKGGTTTRQYADHYARVLLLIKYAPKYRRDKIGPSLVLGFGDLVRVKRKYD